MKTFCVALYFKEAEVFFCNGWSPSVHHSSRPEARASKKRFEYCYKLSISTIQHSCVQGSYIEQSSYWSSLDIPFVYCSTRWKTKRNVKSNMEAIK